MTAPFDSRETRGGGREIKFLVPLALHAPLSDWSRDALAADPFGTGTHGDEYVTSSLYFDTEHLDVLARRGSYRRSKYRVRRYNGASVAFLERKLRSADLVAKRRTLVDLAELARGLAADDAHWPGRWFAGRLAVRRLRPVVQITYQRIARLAMTDQGPLRFTLDTALAARPVHDPAFQDAGGTPALHGHAIVELKFQGDAPALFRLVVERFGLVPARVSKYRLAMTALGHDAHLLGATCAANGGRRGGA